ncbi:hypothetical protein [Noviherbaspirillum malthae]|jgi:hypothetical protein|uniref:hypothetical protein n=1 Tax=Noviherbaspirillum malthae TaxID=1260987 RepID=UPI0018909F59|nr:hypothetical protein [Noviherbaspirillum malthae]
MHKRHTQIGVTTLANAGVHTYSERRRLPLAYAVDICGYAVRLLLSLVIDMPSGALLQQGQKTTFESHQRRDIRAGP